jgi:hypothetical protein
MYRADVLGPLQRDSLVEAHAGARAEEGIEVVQSAAEADHGQPAPRLTGSPHLCEPRGSRFRGNVIVLSRRLPRMNEALRALEATCRPGKPLSRGATCGLSPARRPCDRLGGDDRRYRPGCRQRVPPGPVRPGPGDDVDDARGRRPRDRQLPCWRRRHAARPRPARLSQRPQLGPAFVARLPG